MSKIRKLAGKIKRRVFQTRNKSRLKRYKEKLLSLKDIHKGKRCFIVGNGPSLNVNDLEKLKGEICFGTHRIYNIFDKTDWRPTYYCAQDYNLVRSSIDDIKRLDAEIKFIAMLQNQRYPSISNATFIKMVCERFYPDLPKFSEDLAQDGIYEGFTVSYMCLQIAVYMGFSEIYLLGVDHSYSKVMLPNGEVLSATNVDDHFSENDKLENIPQLYKSTLAYKKANCYAKENGIKVLNATRGGELEAFERVDFDSLF